MEKSPQWNIAVSLVSYLAFLFFLSFFLLTVRRHGGIDRCEDRVKLCRAPLGRGGGVDEAPGYLFLNHPPN